MTVLGPAAGIPGPEPARRSHRLGPASVPERPRRLQPGTDGHTVDPFGSDAVPILVADGDLAPPAGPRPVLRHPRAVAHRQPTPAHAHAD